MRLSGGGRKSRPLTRGVHYDWKRPVADIQQRAQNWRVKAVLFTLSLLVSTVAQAQERPRLCRAIDALVREVQRTHEAQEPYVLQDEPFTFACGRRRGSSVQRAFCAAAQDAVGLEFIHGFPWEVYDCLRNRGIRPEIQTTDHYTGLIDRGRMIRLAARLRGRIRIEIQYTPFPDDRTVDQRFAGYRGRYDMSVTRAD